MKKGCTIAAFVLTGLFGIACCAGVFALYFASSDAAERLEKERAKRVEKIEKMQREFREEAGIPVEGWDAWKERTGLTLDGYEDWKAEQNAESSE